MPSVRIRKPDDPRFKMVGAALKIDWRLARSILIDIWSHMTDAETYVLRPQLIDAIAGEDGFATAMVLSDLAITEPDGAIRVLQENAPFGDIEWLGEDRERKRKGGRARIDGALRDQNGRLLPSDHQHTTSTSPAGDQQDSSSSPGLRYKVCGNGSVDLRSDQSNREICSPAPAGEPQAPAETGREGPGGDTPPADDSVPAERQEALPGADPPPEEARRPRFDFEALYRRYPLKVGKARGIKRCHQQVRTASQFAALERAIENYAQYQARKLDQNEFRPEPKHFSSFMAADVWPDWIDPDPKVLYGRAGKPAEPTQAAPARAPEPVQPPVSLAQMEADLRQLERERNPFVGAMRRMIERRRAQEQGASP